MLNNTKKIKEIYEEIQKKIFYAVPGRWDELYLYASIIDRLGEVQTGEMYFYFMPKGFLRRKFINVYEVPDKYRIEEEEYMKIVKLLYEQIKLLREEFEKENNLHLKDQFIKDVKSNMELQKLINKYNKILSTNEIKEILKCSKLENIEEIINNKIQKFQTTNTLIEEFIIQNHLKERKI